MYSHFLSLKADFDDFQNFSNDPQLITKVKQRVLQFLDKFEMDFNSKL